MSFLFSINKKATATLHPDCYKLCPEFRYLNDKEITCIILAYDYYSPYRQFTEDQRKSRAVSHVFGPGHENIFQADKIKNAVELYRSLQFDHRREQVISYQRRIDALNRMLETVEENDLKKVREIISASKDLRKAIAEIENEIVQEEETVASETEDNVKLSFLERIISNREKFLEVTRKRKAV